MAGSLNYLLVHESVFQDFSSGVLSTNENSVCDIMLPSLSVPIWKTIAIVHFFCFSLLNSFGSATNL